MAKTTIQEVFKPQSQADIRKIEICIALYKQFDNNYLEYMIEQHDLEVENLFNEDGLVI